MSRPAQLAIVRRFAPPPPPTVSLKMALRTMAEEVGCGWKTAWRHWKAGRLPLQVTSAKPTRIEVTEGSIAAATTVLRGCFRRMPTRTP